MGNSKSKELDKSEKEKIFKKLSKRLEEDRNKMDETDNKENSDEEEGNSDAQNKNLVDENNFVIVAAIDFGTTYSGYAFAFRQEFKNDRLKIHTNKWQSKSKPGISFKAPTSILFDTDTKFDSFGYEAEEHYADLIEKKEKYNEWYYFKRFKMKLHEQMRLKRDFFLEDENGKGMEAKTVFGNCIEYLKNHLMEALKGRSREVADSEIYWVITVPAIWNYTAKQFMREAANSAGIQDHQLTLVLEPEAAAIYCKTLPDENFAGTQDRIIIDAFKPGGKYMVLDLGGGTVDTAVHKVKNDGSLVEIHKSCGGPWGGTKVDENFIQHIKKQFGETVIPKLMENCPSDWLRLSEEFESQKMKISYVKDKNLKLPIPPKLIIFSEKEVKDLTSLNTKLKIDDQKTKTFFKPVSDEIILHVSSILEKIQDLKLILMVGSFSESDYMRERMEETFPNIKIIVPLDAGMSVLKGAVLLGCNEVFGTQFERSTLASLPLYKTCRVTARVCRHTYGLGIRRTFEEGKHPVEKKIIVDGEALCGDIFLTLAEEGETIELDEKRSYTLTSSHRETSRKYVTHLFPVYATEKPSIEYTTDPSCTFIGEIRVESPDDGWPEKVTSTVHVFFARTEFSLEVDDSTERQSLSATYDFLD